MMIASVVNNLIFTIMETMSDYTVYCTEEQTQRAFKLGAPIEEVCDVENGYYLMPPTTQQMLGWLREKGLSCQVYSKYGKFCAEVIDITEEEKELRCINEDEIVGTYEQAELDAIDAALDYLEKGE